MKRSNPFESLRQLQTINQHEKIRKIVSSDLEFKSYDQNREAENLIYIAVTTQNSIKSENLPIILIRLNAGESISLCGTCHVSILVGGVNILGAELQGSGDEFGFLPIYSPCTSSLISITGIASGKSHVQPLIPATIEEKAEITRLLADWAVENQPSIIAIKTCNNGLGDVENMMPVLRNCFPNTDKNELIQGISVVSSPVKPKSDRENLFPHFNLPISDVETLENVLRKSNSRDSCHQSVICIVGSKNTGKSSVARYISNRIVSKYRKLCYMECDVGQPEFTPAGIISLHIIDRPLLGPPFTHQMIPFHGIFFGATSPKDDPDAYLGGLIELIKIYRNELSDLPLVVNTCGWVKGVGLELLDSFLSRLLPTDIIHMTNGGTSYILDMIQQKNIDAIELRGVSEVELNKLKLNAADSRALGVISYFSQSAPDIWDFLTPISAKPPYFVSFGAVRIKFLFDEVCKF
jgi:polynucleotide 5'-hydroxyl-kinase GRC3/NOL9